VIYEAASAPRGWPPGQQIRRKGSRYLDNFVEALSFLVIQDWLRRSGKKNPFVSPRGKTRRKKKVQPMELFDGRNGMHWWRLIDAAKSKMARSG